MKTIIAFSLMLMAVVFVSCDGNSHRRQERISVNEPYHDNFGQSTGVNQFPPKRDPIQDYINRPQPEPRRVQQNYGGSFTPDDAYEEGYSEGYDQGRDDGRRGRSYESGYDESNNYYNHYETMYEEGYRSGYDDGYRDGHNDYEEENEEDD